MDFPSLVAANVAVRHRPGRMDAQAEDRYYRGQIGLPRPRLLRLVPAATTTAAGLLLMLLIAPF
jgi:hypothetical protein